MRKNKLFLLLALLLTAATGAWADESETINTASGKTVYTGTHFKITASLGCDDDGIILWNESTSGTATIEALNGENITKIEMHMTYGGQVATYTTTTAGKLVATNSSGNANDISVTDINATSVTIGTSYNGVTWININKFVIYYGPAPAATGYTVSLKDGVEDADKWTVKVGDGTAQALPVEGLSEGQTLTLTYTGSRRVKSVTATWTPAVTWNTVDLSTLAADYTAQDGDKLTGNKKITIADGATVMLDGVNISSGDYCIKCLGDATIILKDGSTNTLTSTSGEYPALSIGDANTTLTIQGSTGVLNVTSGQYCAGIGGGYANTNRTCGNIRIEGGVITAQGGQNGAGIGSDSYEANCGDIIITGGTITAKGGTNAAGIGTGYGIGNPAVCGAITIANTVTKVTATKGDEYAPHSIGKGNGDKASCGTVTIGGTKYWENNAAVGDGATYLATSPLIYDPAAAAAEPAVTGNTVDLSTLTADYTAQDGDKLTGTLSGNKKITIADGATVMLDGVTINGTDDSDYSWAGLTLAGDGTIILSGENSVKGFYNEYPGIFVPENKTLTIQGDGSLTASSNYYGAGIGGGYYIACGNIVIAGGTITANGGWYAAGIGGGNEASCGDITIANTVTKVTATAGEGAPNSIGAGDEGTCGTVTIGGNVTGAITESPYTYQP